MSISNVNKMSLRTIDAHHPRFYWSQPKSADDKTLEKVSSEEYACQCLILMKSLVIVNNLHTIFGSGSGVVVKLLACRARDPSSSPGLATMTSKIWYFLLPNFDMTETIMKQCQSLKQPKKEDSGSLIRHYY